MSIEYTKSHTLTELFPELNLQIYGTIEDPLFLGTQVHEMLKIINSHYAYYDEGDDYVKMKIPMANGQMREQSMFTEQGFYNIIFKSRTALAKKFRKFVTALLKDLRSSGRLFLEKSFQEYKNAIVGGNDRVETGRDLYIMKCGNEYKIGRANSVTGRLDNLQTGNSRKIEILHSWKDHGHHEKNIHERARIWFTRLQGQWFEPNSSESIENLTKWIEAL